MSIEEIEARHQREPSEFRGAVGYPSCAGCTGNWPCDASILAAELKAAREKLEAVAAVIKPWQGPVKVEIGRILKGGE